MINKSKIIGFVTDIIDENKFVFISNNNTNCQLQDIIGLKIQDEKFVLAKIEKIDVQYFLNDSSEYFTSLASDNKIQALEDKSMSPKFSYKIYAIILGVYVVEENNFFEECEYSVNKFTPRIFQKIFSFEFTMIQSLYGLANENDKSIKIGKFLYPATDIEKPCICLKEDVFNSHTLISGVTGSGKTRLSGLIVSQLANNGGHVSIIDPHNEYEGFFHDTKKNFKVYKYGINSTNFCNNQGEINCNKLTYSIDNFTAPVLSRILPHLSSQQKDYIYMVFNKIDCKTKISPKNIIEFTIRDFRESIENEEPNFLKYVTNSHEHAKMDFKNYETYSERYINYLGKYKIFLKSGKLQVIYAVLNKLISAYINKTFQDITSSWENKNLTNVVNILNVDYDSNDNIRRFINATLQSFFSLSNKYENSTRILVVDEAHLLLKEDSDTSMLLNRLLRESRKLGLSLIFITQNEDDVAYEIKSQFQNKFLFREDNIKTIKHLPDQTCYAKVIKGKLNFLMKVDNIFRKGERENM